jgi:FAD/FMN-containing dehydrogenase
MTMEHDAALAATLNALREAIGDDAVRTGDEIGERSMTDYTRHAPMRPAALLLPRTTQQVARAMMICNDAHQSVVPQGGMTGLAGGAIPRAADIAISLDRMSGVEDVDVASATMTVRAGTTLQVAQDAAAQAGFELTLDLGARGSCQIGGNLATNAGGTGVLRYGNTRELCLGLEIVTAQGELWDGLRGLRKDNTGYDLRDLFIGAEGTLGIITAAVMKLHPRPAARVTALAALASPHAALEFLALTQRFAGPLLTGFELMSDFCLKLVGKHFPQMRYPFAESHAQAVLLELSDSESEEHARALFERLMEHALEEGLVEDAVVAENIAQSRAFWNLREHIPLAQAEEGLNLKHDIAVPVSRIGHFIDETGAAIAEHVPGARMVTFGHLGDGNLHYNVQAPEGVDAKAFLTQYQTSIARIVYDSVHRHRGSISAEHGLGQLKIDEAMHYKQPVEVQLMRTLKAALDPLNLMNAGKVIR